MPVIALTQEMGSLAKDVAERVAQIAGWPSCANEVVDNVAERMHVPPSLIRRVREGKAGLVERLHHDKQQFALYTEEEILHQAERGNVILRGWGATRVLHAVPHVLRVRVTRSVRRARQVGDGRPGDRQPRVGGSRGAPQRQRTRRAHAQRPTASPGAIRCCTTW
jgi:hypothetical protein